MDKSLKNTINETPLFASFPIQFLDDNLITNDCDAENVLYDAVRLLHRIGDDKTKLPKFYEIIDRDDFFKLKLFLTERLYCLRHDILI